MRFCDSKKEPRSLLNTILFAGLAGGAAEIIWVVVCSVWLQGSAAEVARQIAATLWPALASGVFGVAVGIAIHFVLSMALAACFAVVIWLPFAQQRGKAVTQGSAIVVLAGVWAVNFLIVLPEFNPVFVTLMPYGVTLFSKILFGSAMAWALNGFQLMKLSRRILIRLDTQVRQVTH